MIPPSFTESTGNTVTGARAPFIRAPGRVPTIYIQNTAVNIDLSAVLLIGLLRWRMGAATPLNLRVFEFRSIEAKLNRLMAIEDAFGSLRNLSPEQLHLFEEAVRRRDFFDTISP